MYKTSVYTLVNGATTIGELTMCIFFRLEALCDSIINRAKFYFNQIRGFDSVGGRILGFPIRKRSRR